MTDQSILRNQIAKILGVRIPPRGYKQTFNELDRQGMMDGRKMMDMLAVVLSTLEAYEERTDIQP